MNNRSFNDCRIFLEKMIENSPENHELIKAYVKLIEEKTKFDITQLKVNEELEKSLDKNETEQLKADLEVEKVSLERNISR